MAVAAFPFGYCTNVHAGVRLESAKANLVTHACAVRQQVIPEGDLPVGLWLADAAVAELNVPGACARMREWLAEKRLIPYTFNGFPQRDFHQRVVKHAVYEPSWLENCRCQHTLDLAGILQQFLATGGVGSISTLPLGWPSHGDWTAEQRSVAANNLRLVAQRLHQIFEQSGIEIVLAIEPEPGCILDTAQDIVDYFDHFLLNGGDHAICRRHLSVCHDICHSAVMFEPQEEVLQAYLQHGIRIGKVKVTS